MAKPKNKAKKGHKHKGKAFKSKNVCEYC